MTCHVVTSRLWDLYWVRALNLYRPSRMFGVICREGLSAVLKHRSQPKYVSDEKRTRKHPTLAWDLGRVRFFYEELLAGRLFKPIEVDNACNGGHIYPIPVLLDGHHRLAAGWLAKAPTIPVNYGGRLDLKNYLTGRRKTCPKE